MAQTPEAVINFLTSLKEKLTEKAGKELEKLLQVKKEHVESLGEEFDGKINAWDLSFYNNRLLKQEYGGKPTLIIFFYSLVGVFFFFFLSSSGFL